MKTRERKLRSDAAALEEDGERGGTTQLEEDREQSNTLRWTRAEWSGHGGRKQGLQPPDRSAGMDRLPMDSRCADPRMRVEACRAGRGRSKGAGCSDRVRRGPRRAGAWDPVEKGLMMGGATYLMKEGKWGAES